MRKFLMTIGIFTVFTYNVVNARGYYEENGYYYEEEPRYVRKSSKPTYYEENGYYEESPRYVRRKSEPTYYEESPRYERRAYQSRHYKPISREEEREYREKQYYKEENRIRPYIGFDVIASDAKFGKGTDEYFLKDPYTREKYFKDGFISGSLAFGARINKNWGVEAFYQKSGEEEKEESFREDYIYIKGISKISYEAYGVDFQYYVPINQDFEILASLGLAQYNFKTKYQYNATIIGGGDYLLESGKMDFDSLGIRFGVGGQYYLTDNLALRAMARYIKLNDDDYIKNLMELSLGLRYMF